MFETARCTGARHDRRGSTPRPHPTYEALVLRDLPRLHFTALHCCPHLRGLDAIAPALLMHGEARASPIPAASGTPCCMCCVLHGSWCIAYFRRTLHFLCLLALQERFTRRRHDAAAHGRSRRCGGDGGHGERDPFALCAHDLIVLRGTGQSSVARACDASGGRYGSHGDVPMGGCRTRRSGRRGSGIGCPTENVRHATSARHPLKQTRTLDPLVLARRS